MTIQRVDFYLVPGLALSDTIDTVVRVVEKAFENQHLIHVLSNDEHESEMLSSRLWHAKPESFLPNEIVPNAQNYSAPITLYTSPPEDASHPADFLIATTPELPQNSTIYARAALVIRGQDPLVQRARATYKLLKSQQVEVNIHDLRR